MPAPTRAQSPVRREKDGTLDIRPARVMKLDPVVARRRALTLLGMSVLVPGWAQIRLGDEYRGRAVRRWWVGIWMTVALFALLALVSRSTALLLATSPLLLLVIAVAALVWAVVWMAVLIDAWRLGRPADQPRSNRLVLAAALVACLVFTTTISVGVARRAWAAADLLNGTFGSGSAHGAVDGRYNVLLLGGDAGADRVGVRPDTVMVASIDASTGRTVLISLPRNLENVPFADGSRSAQLLPRGWDCGDECLLNAIYMWGQQHRSEFGDVPDPGVQAMTDAVEGVTRLRIQYYVLIDLRGFQGLIDALGGVDIRVERPIPIGGGSSPVTGYVPAGQQHLDGYHALWYARSRHGSSDYDRMQRQRTMVSAVAQQMSPVTVLQKFQDVAGATKNLMTTNIPASQLSMLLELAAQAKSQPVSQVAITPPLINPAYPDYHVIRTAVADGIEATKHDPSPTAGSG